MTAPGQGDKGKKTRKATAATPAAAPPTRIKSPGLLEACRRIEVAARGKAEELDLGGLGLTEIPEELYALTHLKVLYLGAPKRLQKIGNCSGYGIIGRAPVRQIDSERIEAVALRRAM